MPEDEAADDGADDQSVGPIDSDVLERIGSHLAGSDRFATVAFRPEYAPNSVVAEYDMGYFPAGIERAYLRIRWFVTDDFTVHYSEQYRGREEWHCRWDRHPNGHNTRDHFHPPPDAATPGEAAEYPWNWREMLSRVLNAVNDHGSGDPWLL